MTAWKQTFACSFVAQILSIVGFSFAIPFLPFYIRDLGIEDPAQQAWWAGVVLATTGLTLALFAPIWGMLADRFGRRPMVVRSMIGGTVVLLLMSYARNITDLVICRLLQGALTGTVAASVALVASVTPQRRSGLVLGMMQSAVFIGLAIGPLFGGIVADQFGYRAAFRAGAGIMLLGGVLIHFGAQETFTPASAQTGGTVSFRTLLRNGGFLASIGIMLAVRFSNTIVNPSFPLVIRDMLTSTERLNSVTGIIMAASGITGALAAALLGHLGDRLGHRRVVIICSACTGLTAAAHAAVGNLVMLTVVHLLFGFAVSGTLPATNAMIQRSTDPRHMGKAFGTASAISMLGLALGPLTGGFLAGMYGIRMPFLVAGACQLALSATLLLWGRRPVLTGTGQ